MPPYFDSGRTVFPAHAVVNPHPTRAELELSPDADRKFGGFTHEIWVEPEGVERDVCARVNRAFRKSHLGWIRFRATHAPQ